MISTGRALVLAAVGLGLGACALVAVPAGPAARPSRTNVRGRPVPVTLGVVVFVASVGAQAITGLVSQVAGTTLGRTTWTLLGASALVFAAGFLDDLVPGGPRGLAGHARALVRGRLTTGVVKAAAAVGAALAVVAATPGRTAVEAGLGVVLMAGAANVLNGLDVAPGRAVKAFLVPAVALLLLGSTALLARLAGAAAAALWPDLRERGMLGDGGAYLLGFVLGASLYLLLPAWAVGVGAAVAVGLNLLAETVTLSRVIAAVPPLRWADRIGRLADPPPEPAATSRPEPSRRAPGLC
jgi:Glycosyl transferase family 4